MEPGTTLGPYEITGPLGKGGMGEVYRANDTNLNRQVAVKVLPTAFAQDTERLARFEREAKTLASLNHPNIAQIYGFEKSTGVHALVMELVEGPTLADRITEGPIPVDEALPIANQIAEALEAAHEQGIIHRDLKPANVKVRPDGTVKVLDFGLAKAMDPVGDPTSVSQSPTLSMAATQAGIILGTAAYMSPEQAKGHTVDKRTDVWAFGAVLYEMLTGKMAFEAEDVSDTLAAVLRADVDWSILPRELSPAIRTYLERCLKRNPKQRVRDIGDVRLALEGAFETAATQTDVVASVVQPAWGRTRERFAWFVAGFTVIALGVFIFMPDQGGIRSEQVVHLQMDLTVLATPKPAVSPDGRHVAFTGVSDGTRLLWVRSLDTLQSRPLAGTEGALHPFWSPDSDFIGFGSDRDLKRVALTGGFPETVADLPGPNFRGGTWAAGNVILFSAGTGPIYQVDAAGGAPIAATMLDDEREETTHRWPYFLPDGNHFLYTARSLSPQFHGIYVGSLDSTDRIRVVNALSNAEFVEPGFLLYARDNELIAQSFDSDDLEVTGEPIQVAPQVEYRRGTAASIFSTSSDGLLVYQRTFDNADSQLAWVGRDGTVIDVVANDQSNTGDFSVSADGTKIVGTRVDSQTGTPDIWVIDVSRRIDTPFTRHPAYDQDPVWSPDGSQIVWASHREGPAKLFRMPTEGSSPAERLLDSTTFNRPTDWARDGRFIVFTDEDLETNFDLWALSVTEDSAPIPIAQTEFNEAQGRLSPDSRWIAYSVPRALNATRRSSA